LPDGAVVVDVGSGTGGMSAALASALAERGSGKLLLVDAVPELLSIAAEAAGGAVGSSEVEIETLIADAAADKLYELVPPAQLIWAAAMVHHLPDQQAAITDLTQALGVDGVLALAEGGLETQCLPWDLGVGNPGLQRRLLAAHNEWFREMRAAMPGSVRLPYGWNVALQQAGLVDVDAFSVLIDLPAPPSDGLRGYVAHRLEWLVEVAHDRLAIEDRRAVDRLLDPDKTEFVGRRDDLYLLGTYNVHFGVFR
jgi:SAM-dependent methyltransferase